MEDTLITWIKFSLSNRLVENAIFLGERLVAISRAEEALHLLASAYLDDNKPHKSFSLLKDSKSESNRYLGAVAALRIGKWQDGVDLLLGPKGEPANLEEVPNGASGLYILGQLCRKLNQRERAVKYFSKCLELNPLMWCSYEALCKLGENIEAETFFGASDENTPEFATVADAEAAQQEQQAAAADLAGRTSKKPRMVEITAPAPANIPKKIQSRRLVTETPSSKQAGSHAALLATPALAKRLLSSFMMNSPHSGAFSPQTPATNLFADRFSAMPSPAAPLFAPASTSTKPNLNLTASTPMRTATNTTTAATPVASTPAGASESSTSSTAGEMAAPMKRPPRTTRGVSVPTLSTSPRRSVRLKADTTAAAAIAEAHGTVTHSTATAATASSIAKKPAVKKAAATVATQSSAAAPIAPVKAKRGASVSQAVPPKVPAAKVSLRKSAEDAIPLSSFNVKVEEPAPAAAPPAQSQQNQQQQQDNALIGTVAILTLLKKLGDAYRKLCRFDCLEAIEAFKALPLEQYKTGWVLTNVAKAHFEMLDYNKAKEVFDQVRRIDKLRVAGTEIFSTALWHLRRENDLSYLAQELTDVEKTAPETLCTIGNCFSLQREHEMAIKYFQRAMTVDPDFVYAYTLCGHEYMATDNWDAALDSFRKALRLDPRHYNAWYGLGMIYLRQEKFEYAEYHFRKAISINSRSTVLFCYVGMCLAAQRKFKEALDALNISCRLDPKNMLAKFKRASVFVQLRSYKEALVQLEVLNDASSREIAILYMMARIYKRLGEKDKARQYFSLALDLDRDSKTSNLIKSMLETVDQEDDPNDNNFEL